MATALYTLAIVVTPRLPTGDVLTAATVIRLVTYSSCGVLVGWFANEHRRHLGQLRELAERDFLTGILNTRMFDDALARRCSGARPFLLLLADMDNLKLVNDTHGHTAGNAELRRLANALAEAVGPDDELARVGGDEFAILTEAGVSEAGACLRGIACPAGRPGHARHVRLGGGSRGRPSARSTSSGRQTIASTPPS